jgi:hypothetical protein
MIPQSFPIFGYYKVKESSPVNSEQMPFNYSRSPSTLPVFRLIR